MQPTHEHDCASCVFLGSTVGLNPARTYDYYFCVAEDELVIRHGADGEYASFSLENARMVARNDQNSQSASRWAIAVAMLESVKVAYPEFIA